MPTGDVTIRPLVEADLDVADRIMRLAFGTFVGLTDPTTFLGDGRYVHHRFRADPTSAFAAELDGEVVGSNFAAHWGSFGFFGPLSIRPDLWDRGVGRRLMEPVLGRFDEWHVSMAGLFTFASSPKHLALYQRYGFRPRHLTALMTAPVAPGEPEVISSRFSELADGDRSGVLRAAFEVTDTLWDGLDVGHEVIAIYTQRLGESVFVWEGPTLAAFAACHVGPRTEAGSGTCYVKFAAARSGPDAARRFADLMDAVSALAASRGATTVAAGVNTARTEAYEWMLGRGFRTQVLGVAMHRPNEPAFSRPGVWVLDDWR
jgi:predicted N-acetyltransferase YhbS